MANANSNDLELINLLKEIESLSDVALDAFKMRTDDSHLKLFASELAFNRRKQLLRAKIEKHSLPPARDVYQEQLDKIQVDIF